MNDLYTAPPELRPLSFGELLDRAIRLFGQAWRPLLLIGLIGATPTILLNLFGSSMAAPSNPPEFSIASLLSQGRVIDPSSSLLFMMGNGLVTLIVHGALTLIASQAILGQRINLVHGLVTALRRFFAMLWTTILIGLVFMLAGVILMGIGFVAPVPFLLFPLSIGAPLVIGLFYTFCDQAILLEEHRGGSDAMGRSIELVKGRFWPILGFSILVGAALLILTFSLGFLAGLPANLMGAEGSTGLLFVVGGLLGALPTAIASPILILARTLLYYDTRIRQEGFDLTVIPPITDRPVS